MDIDIDYTGHPGRDLTWEIPVQQNPINFEHYAVRSSYPFWDIPTIEGRIGKHLKLFSLASPKIIVECSESEVSDSQTEGDISRALTMGLAMSVEALSKHAIQSRNYQHEIVMCFWDYRRRVIVSRRRRIRVLTLHFYNNSFEKRNCTACQLRSNAVLRSFRAIMDVVDLNFFNGF